MQVCMYSMYVCKYVKVQICKCTSIYGKNAFKHVRMSACFPICYYNNMQLYNCASMKLWMYADLKLCKYASMLVCKYASMLVC